MVDGKVALIEENGTSVEDTSLVVTSSSTRTKIMRHHEEHSLVIVFNFPASFSVCLSCCLVSFN